jgi:hypothetical protein
MLCERSAKFWDVNAELTHTVKLYSSCESSPVTAAITSSFTRCTSGRESEVSGKHATSSLWLRKILAEAEDKLGPGRFGETYRCQLHSRKVSQDQHAAYMFWLRAWLILTLKMEPIRSPKHW